MDLKGIQLLVNYIEANLRSSTTSGLTFVDSRHFSNRLKVNQNHVIFGRRGSGKTSLLNSITGTESIINISINLEDFKDITFPNILIQVLISLFEEINENIQTNFNWFKSTRNSRRIKKEIKNILKNFKFLINEPDFETQELNTIESKEKGINLSSPPDGFKVKFKGKKGFSKELKRNLIKSKIDYLKINLTNYKKLLSNISLLFSSKPIFLILDDFYFIDKKIQPHLVDYFHRLTKSTNLFLKIATIKYRSKLYRRDESKYIGTELGHDIFDIDIDYTLDDFNLLQNFMKQLLDNAIEKSECKISFNDLFSGDGFSQLCLASGGVPRDFLSLFVNLANKISEDNKIGKIQVNEASIQILTDKLDSLKKDSGDDDTILEFYLYKIKHYVYNQNKTNAFLIAKEDFDKNPAFKQIIRELIDLRLIHLVDQNTSKASSDGRRYEAFIIDICLYDNSRPQYFKQIQPSQRDEKSRRDSLRASPVIELERLKNVLSDKNEDLKSKLIEESKLFEQMELSFE